MIREILKKKRLFCDGGMGSMLVSMGLTAGETSESWNLLHPDKIIQVHRAYIKAGADIITANTFGINCEKYENYDEMIAAALGCAKQAVGEQKEKFVALDLGPTGRLLEPLGDLSFERAVEIFAENIKSGVKHGADLILIETMNDSLETKAAVIAAKENSNLPVFVTNVYDESGHLMTGADPLCMVAMLEGLRVDALGINCSLGPDKMLPVVKELAKYSSTPIIVNPNAGLPSVEDGKTVYNVNAESFSDYMAEIAECGVSVLGGCCGTTPEYIKKTVEKCRKLTYSVPKDKNITAVSSYTHGEIIGDKPLLIGERINPTGKKKFKEALKNNDINYILNEGLTQSQKGVHILDVNVGLPEIDERAVMLTVIKELQAVCDKPLQIDTSNPDIMAQAMRIYNGKPLINSVNGNKEIMDKIFPAVAKYGGTVVALTLNDEGIPETAEERVEIALDIIAEAQRYGIAKKDIIVDPLTLTISSDPQSAKTTLKAVKMLSDMGINTVLGVSNVSFGLPTRELINSVFFTQALTAGLKCAIMNPFSEGMMNSYHSYLALGGFDSSFEKYIAYCEGVSPEAVKTETVLDLKTAVVKGLKVEAAKETERLLSDTAALDIINNHIIPALNEIGSQYDSKKAFLPQLLMSAEAAVAAIDIAKAKIPEKESGGEKIIIATVKGDIHDIGKNIVKVMLQSYGYRVLDLGRDVAPEKIVETAVKENCKLVGLSALMTTTVPAMEQTVKLLHQTDSKICVMVGGAVLNPEYAEMIGADKYAKDAMGAVRIAEEFYK